MKLFWRWAVVAVLVVIITGLAAPRISADRFRPRIQQALEAALNRPVHLGAVHLNLFTGPGFSVDNVLIDDDPSAGIEPFAHVESVEARLRWTSLLSGHVSFSSLRLDNPSVNVVKTAAGPWNIQPLLDRRPSPGTPHAANVPDIQIRGGRIDFKFGDTKSVFYISDADVDVYPNQNGEVVIRFSGSPARTDQSSQSFGELTARGLVRPGSNGEAQLSMGLHLDRTPISEITRLFHGSDIGVHGYVLANAKIAGPVSKLDIAGDLNISDLHRWDLMPSPGEDWPLNYRGLLDLSNHHLELATLTTPAQADPVSADFRLDNYLAAPKWSGNLHFRDLPAGLLVETARRFGAPLPAGVQVDGKVQGGVGYSSDSGLGGQLTLAATTVRFAEGTSAQVDSAQVQLTPNSIVLGPADVLMDDNQSAQIAGEYAFDNSSARFSISTRRLPVTSTLLSAAQIPGLSHLEQGSWSGSLCYEKVADSAGVWSGQYELQNGVVQIPGLAAPVRIAVATVQMSGGALQATHMRGRAGAMKFEGDYRFDPTAVHSHRMRLAIPELQLSDLERLLLPTLQRDEGLLARAFRRSQPIPKWLADRDADIALQISNLTNGDTALGTLNGRAIWRGASITVSALGWVLDDMHGSGKLLVNLAKSEPAYDLNGALENFDYRNGQLDIAGELQTTGIGLALLANLRSKGTFQGRDIMLAADNEVREVSGSYRIAGSYGAPRLLLSDLQVLQGSDTLIGQGASQPDGHVILELSSGRKQVRLTGMLLPVHPEFAPVR